MALSKEKQEELNKELFDLMMNNFEYACHIAKVDVIQAYVCIERKKGKTYGEIAMVIGIRRESVFERAVKCSCDGC